MNISLHQARNRLVWNWVGLAAPLIALVFIQTMFLKYGTNAEDALSGLGWVFQCVMPVGLVMIAALTVKVEAHSGVITVDNVFLYRLSLSLIWFYYMFLYSIILLQPITQFTAAQMFLLSGWFLGPLQGVVLTLTSKFFIENIA